MTAIASHPRLHELAEGLADAQPTGALAAVVIGPPVPRPPSCFAIGLNYRSHVAESAMEVPEVPLVFTKFPSCIVGPDADVELRSETADYEAELVVVIGTPGRDIAAADAWDHVAGRDHRTGHLGPCAAVRREAAALRPRQVPRHATVRRGRWSSRPIC